MKIGINGTGLVQKASIEAIRQDAERAEADGFASYWLAEHPTGGFDAMTVLASIAPSVPALELGTAVVPTFPRHPMAMAGQALTTNTACNGNFCLGVGLSHEVMMAQLGIGFDKPIRHLREYLSILMPLLDHGTVEFEGETLSCSATLFSSPDKRPGVVVAALGPQALRVAGARTDGTTLAWVGPKTIAEHIGPRLAESANRAGRVAPRIIATLPVVVTSQPDRIRESIGKTLTMYGSLPSYRAMFDREGVEGPSDLAIAGSRAEVEDRLSELKSAGVTDFAASVYGTSKDEHLETRELLRDFAR